jgi:nuclear transport factor 2 (NTF2) superfamily protein
LQIPAFSLTQNFIPAQPAPGMQVALSKLQYKSDNTVRSRQAVVKLYTGKWAPEAEYAKLGTIFRFPKNKISSKNSSKQFFGSSRR